MKRAAGALGPRGAPGAPLALQVTVLLVGILVVAQGVPLALTLLLPPQRPSEYRLADVAAALRGGALATSPRPLVRAVRSEPPSLQSAGWLAPERSREDLARLLGASPQDVRLLFYAPSPFAGVTVVASLAPPRRLYMAALVLADEPGEPGGAGPGGGGPGDGGHGRLGLSGERSGASARSAPGGGRGDDAGAGPRGGGGRGFAPGRMAAPADAGVVSRYGSGRTAAGGGAPATATLGGQAATVLREPTTGGARAPFSAEAAAAARAATGVGGASLMHAAPARAQVVLIAPAARLLGMADLSAATDLRPAQADGARAARAEPPPPPRPRFATARPPAPAAVADLARPAAPVVGPPVGAAPALTPAQALAAVHAQATRAAADRGGYLLPPTGSEAHGLFKAPPPPFVQGEFVAALRIAPNRWITVQPQPEPFPNAWQGRILLWFLAAFALVAPLGLLFARRLARPLGRFAEAAERLGKDPTGQHLQLAGPAELGRAARAFNQMQGRLKRYIDDRTAMVGAISHDLRTPLARMRFRLERVAPEVRGPVLADIAQMEEMISSVLVFIRDASEPAVRERVDLRSILECVVDGAAEVGGEAVLDPGEPVPVDVDSLSVQRVVTNLVENALKYGERAHVRMYAENGEAVAEVEDAGPGLPEEEMERVFLPFYRSEQARTLDTRGIGLGLAVSRSIARAHGGDVRLLSRGQGLVAQLRLPIAARAA